MGMVDTKKRTSLKNWGTSKALRIPKPFIEQLGIQDDDTVEMSVVDGAIVIKKVLVVKVKSIREMYEEFYGTDFETAVRENPYDEDEIVPWSGAGIEEIW